MEHVFAARMGKAHRSFIREILKVTADPEIISFAGGLPNPELFPVGPLAEAAERVLTENGPGSLQYSTTEGDPRLRAWIADRYRERFDLAVDPDNVLVTTGSQQCLDLAAKVFIDPGTKVLVERPGYLGAIQAFSLFEPEFVTVELTDEGPDLAALEAAFQAGGVRLYYAVPNFQNPSGRSYSLAARQRVAELCLEHGVLFVEDDPYGELRFEGEHLPPVYAFTRGDSLLMGSFSKIAAPGFRIGWMVAPGDIYDKLVTAKQAADLHTSTLTQAILVQWLATGDLDEHIERIRERYREHRDCMLDAVARHFPEGVEVTCPEGGMFLWVMLPGSLSSMDLLDEAVRCKVAFVPGTPFYVDDSGANTLRLNFSNASPERIEEGVARLGRALQGFLQQG